ncbi:MAG: hypothetical protein PHT64_00365 [Bacteroidales bacterium]|nr:hypothetical protein [Bacteroidales bacterium]MDD3521621.1 hypothetical protein [Bacteroidales bacterium]MDD4030318.1 hypothetical protein [Bacteroidales bacterium]MDD4434823.1 hypothetical protein [Bacteroidales bacterium]MDD5732235.1 hypothetical protein [Bacteroidales bacterium]
MNVTIFCGSGVLQSGVIAKNHCRHKENADFYFLPGLPLHVPIVAATTKNGELFPFADASSACTSSRCLHKEREALSFCRGFPFLVEAATFTFMRFTAKTTTRWPSMWCAKHVWRLFLRCEAAPIIFLLLWGEGGK